MTAGQPTSGTPMPDWSRNMGTPWATLLELNRIGRKVHAPVSVESCMGRFSKGGITQNKCL